MTSSSPTISLTMSVAFRDVEMGVALTFNFPLSNVARAFKLRKCMYIFLLPNFMSTTYNSIQLYLQDRHRRIIFIKFATIAKFSWICALIITRNSTIWEQWANNGRTMQRYSKLYSAFYSELRHMITFCDISIFIMMSYVPFFSICHPVADVF